MMTLILFFMHFKIARDWILASTLDGGRHRCRYSENAGLLDVSKITTMTNAALVQTTPSLCMLNISLINCTVLVQFEVLSEWSRASKKRCCQIWLRQLAGD